MSSAKKPAAKPAAAAAAQPAAGSARAAAKPAPAAAKPATAAAAKPSGTSKSGAAAAKSAAGLSPGAAKAKAAATAKAAAKDQTVQGPTPQDLAMKAAAEAAATQQAEEERRLLAEQEAAREREFALRNGPVTCRYNQCARDCIFCCCCHSPNQDRQLAFFFCSYKEQFTIANGELSATSINDRWSLDFAFPNAILHLSIEQPGSYDDFSVPLQSKRDKDTFTGLFVDQTYFVLIEEDAQEVRMKL
jgi:hypothetical protein